MQDNPIFPSKTASNVNYLGDRTGITLSSMIPLFILFAGRNNFLQWITRWDFATFITFHKWVSRIMFVLVVIHAVCFSIAFSTTDHYFIEMRRNYIVWGTVAIVVGGIIMVQGMLFLRRQWYETFLLVHIVLAPLFIAGSWIHVTDMGYSNFYYATAAVWVFDRIVRLGRIVSFGFPIAEVSLLPDENLKVVVPKPSYWKAIPGGHVFIHFIKPSCFWQSHPFTFTAFSEKNEIVLYFKVKDGITRQLYFYLATHPFKKTIRVALEGPYGESTVASRYVSAIFIAGGGVMVFQEIYSEVVDLATRSGLHTKQVLKLVWVVRDYISLYWFYEELLAFKNYNIDTTIYITKPKSNPFVKDFYLCFPSLMKDYKTNFDQMDRKIKEDSDKYPYEVIDSKSDTFFREHIDAYRITKIVKSELSHINFREGRPRIEDLVFNEIVESNGTIAFVTCGHPIMVDELPYAVAHNLFNAKGNRVEFFQQLQVWA